eukprot:3953975-Pleurochrysis_carterae.AAC.1
MNTDSISRTESAEPRVAEGGGKRGQEEEKAVARGKRHCAEQEAVTSAEDSRSTVWLGLSHATGSPLEALMQASSQMRLVDNNVKLTVRNLVHFHFRPTLSHAHAPSRPRFLNPTLPDAYALPRPLSPPDLCLPT